MQIRPSLGVRLAQLAAGTTLGLATLAPLAVHAQEQGQGSAQSGTGRGNGAGGEGRARRPRPELDLSMGVQLPPRDTSRLPTDFVGAVKTQAVNPNWDKVPYKPKSRRDFTGIWENQGGIAWAPAGNPEPRPPLSPDYRKIYDTNLENGRLGKPTGDITANCLPQGMPRIMTMTYPMEIVMAQDHVHIFAEWQEQTRRIFTDGRPLDPDPDPTFYGQAVGHWEGDVLAATTFGLREDTNLEATGMPKSDKMIAYERIWLAEDDLLRDEITLVDPKSLTKPWTVTKTYKRMPPGSATLPYVCLENNRNPIGADGTIHTTLKSGG